MMAKTITGVEIRSTHRRVRDVINQTPNDQLPTSKRPFCRLGVGNWELARLQPLYGIDRSAVDAKLEIEGRRSRRCGADPAELCPGVNALSSHDFERPEVAIKR